MERDWVFRGIFQADMGREYAVVDRIINHLKLSFVADKPPAPHMAFQELLMVAETSAEYFP